MSILFNRFKKKTFILLLSLINKKEEHLEKLDQIRNKKLFQCILKLNLNDQLVQKTIDQDSGCITCMVKLDNNIIATGSWDRDIKIWNLIVINYNCIMTLTGHKNSVKCIIKISYRHIASGSEDSSIRIWDYSNGTCLKYMIEENKYMYHVTSLMKLSTTKLMSGSTDNTIKIWDLVKGQCLKIHSSHTKPVICIIKLNNHQLITGSEDSIKLLDLQSGKFYKTIIDKVALVAISKLNENQIASGTNNYSIKIWDFPLGICVKNLVGHKNYISSIVQLSKSRIASGSCDCSIKIWDVITGNCFRTLNGHSGYIIVIRYLKTKLISGSGDKTIKIWDY